jgi:hypothetical protein
MKQHLIILALFLLLCFGKVVAQPIGINTTTPDASSILDIKANGSAVGLLLPRLTVTQRDATINSLISGLIIYNTTSHTIEVATSVNLWTDVIYRTTSLASNQISFQTGGLGIGTSIPYDNAVLDITSTTKGVVLPMATADPTGVEGMIYYNTTTNQVRVYDGTSWIVLTY